MTRVLLHVFFLLLISFFASTQSVDLVSMEVKKVIDSTYQSLIKKNKVKGLSLAIVDQGKLVYAQGYGFENEEKKIPATSKSIYRVGSITKSFTALSLMQLQEQGKLHLDDELKQHIPEFSIGFQNNTAHPIHLRKVLSHTSGLPSDVMNGFFTENPPAVDWLIAQAKQLKMSYPNAYSHAYSNFGYALLGEVVERRSEKDYELYIQDQIFAPLKMTSSFIKLGEGMVTPSSYFKNELIDEPLIRDAPAGLIHSNVEDMSNYLLMYLGRGKFGDKRLIDSLAILEMEKDQTTDLLLENQGHFGLGLYSGTHYLKSGNDSSLVHVIGHGGDTYTFHADMKYIPELGVGVIVLTNSSSGIRIRSGEKLLEIYLKAKNGSTLGEVAVRPKPEIKKDFRKGTYVIMNSIVNCENEQKIKFRQGPSKVIAERDDAGYYNLKAVLFGFIPFKVKDQVFYFERINETTYLRGLNLKDNSQEYIGYELTVPPVFAGWKNAYGKYEVVNAIPCQECAKMGVDFKNFTLRVKENEGLLSLSFGGKGIDMGGELSAICESENCAITIGIGRGNAETIRILENGNLYYSGFEFKRSVKKE